MGRDLIEKEENIIVGEFSFHQAQKSSETGQNGKGK